MTHMEEMQEKLKGNNRSLSEDSLEHACVSDKSQITEVEIPSDESYYVSDEVRDGKESFYLLPPIEEYSEPASPSGGVLDGSIANHEKRSLSLHNLNKIGDDNNHDLRSRTFPRSKASSSDFWGCKSGPKHAFALNSTLYPLEPRELNPESFEQLHTADSCEELQEFLLLESQCMSSEAGLAGAFISSSG